MTLRVKKSVDQEAQQPAQQPSVPQTEATAPGVAALTGNLQQSVPISVSSSEFTIGENLPDVNRILLEALGSVKAEMSVNRTRKDWLKGLTSSTPKALRKDKGTSPVSAAQKRSANVEIKQLDYDYILLEEKHRDIWKKLTNSSKNALDSLDALILREKSRSDFYLKRNKHHIMAGIAKLINKVYSEDSSVVHPLVRASRSDSSDAVANFQTMFIEFLRVHKHDLYVLCTGKDSFKLVTVTAVRSSLRSWNPRRSEFSI